MFQSYALYPHMTVFDNLAFSLKMRNTPAGEIQTKVQEAAKLLEIESLLDRRPFALSGGQRQRVALGRAIVRQPKIFLFDEPLSNLDAALRATMRVELARLHRRLGTTIVYVTHDQAEALTLGSKIIVLHEGNIQQIGPASEIYHRPHNHWVARFVGSPQMNIFDGRMDERGEVFSCGDLKLNLAALLGQPAKTVANSPLTIGVRAEDLAVAGPNTGWLQGEIEIIEDLGSDQFLHLKCDGQSAVARTNRQREIATGQTIGLNVNPEQLHFFRNGERIELA